MSLRWLVLLGPGFAVDAAAEDLRRVAQDLQVRVENLEGEVAVNGLPITISRAVGPGVPALAERLVGQWRLESGQDSVHLLSCCGWKLASRIHNGDSQVVQWRSTALASELLWSTLGSRAPIAAPPMADAPLLPDCSWSGPVHGRVAASQYLQVSARCPLDPEAALAMMIRRMASEGWHWQRQSRLVVFAERGQVKAQLIASPLQGPASFPSTGQSSLVLLESRNPGEPRP